MSKYDALGKFLRNQQRSEVPMTFAEIERVTGVKLPRTAHSHRAWWSNNASNSVMTKVWLQAGFRSERVDMEGKKLVFKRVTQPNTPRSIQGTAESGPSFKTQERSETPHRHPALGAMKGCVVVEVGYDLTQPVMPEWAELIVAKHGREQHK